MVLLEGFIFIFVWRGFSFFLMPWTNIIYLFMYLWMCPYLIQMGESRERVTAMERNAVHRKAVALPGACFVTEGVFSAAFRLSWDDPTKAHSEALS